MTVISEKQKEEEIRKRLSIEVCDNFIKRLNPLQKKEIKMGALIAIKNLIKESTINDPILYSFLVDTIVDPDKEVRNTVVKVIKDVGVDLYICPQIIELLEIKLKEATSEIKKEIDTLLHKLKNSLTN